jgi:signal transduction histidine kinase/CheY-like chemotaxis protein
VAFVAAPLIAWATKGRYYLARREPSVRAEPPINRAESPAVRAEPVEAPYLGQAFLRRCVICERDYEGEDMASCPAYGGPICSLCCSLDARCHDLCKPPEARVREQADALLKWLTPRAWWPHLDTGLVRYLLLMAAVALGLAGLMAAVYRVELDALGPRATDLAPALGLAFVKVYAALMLAGGVIGWWMVLTSTSRRVAQEESNRQTELLVREIDSHRRTDQELQRARRAAESANQAKTRYLSAISHELRTPLNSILGYAQLLDEDPTMPLPRKHGIGVIRRGGEHLLGLIEGTLDIARIESGKLTLEPRPMRLRESLVQIVEMFELQATAKGLRFEHDVAAAPERVKADERRLTQILINLLGNAVKFTRTGRIAFRATHVRDMAVFEIEDTGPGIAPDELERVFEPFARGAAEAGSSGTHGTGLGLTIAKMLTELMGGEMTVRSKPGEGTLFRVRLFLPALQGGAATLPTAPRGDCVGERRRVLVVDNEEVDRTLLARRLQGHGFEVLEAGSGVAALGLLQELATQRGEGKDPPVDAIFMDLAMPGIDGWATIRALRAQGLSTAPVAIVSANAFDKNLDNDVGITPADFITKPVRLDELLDWLGTQLQLQWLPRGAAPAAAPAAAGVPPPRELLLSLQQVVALGYPRGVWHRLDQIAAAHPECTPWLAALRGMADRFQFDRMTKVIDGALAHAADR